MNEHKEDFYETLYTDGRIDMDILDCYKESGWTHFQKYVEAETDRGRRVMVRTTHPWRPTDKYFKDKRNEIE